MNANKIKGLLIIAGVSVVDIATGLGVSRQAVYQTINGEIKPRRIREAIAAALKTTVPSLWDDAKPEEQAA